MKLFLTLLMLGVASAAENSIRALPETGLNPEIGFEAHAGSCQTVSQFWGILDEEQRLAFNNDMANVEAECGVNGDCAPSGGSQGCCRYTQGNSAFSCDTDDEFPYALCICNSHTAPQNTPAPIAPKEDPPSPAEVTVITPTVSPSPTKSPTTPPPTPSPTLPSDNCQRYNSESILYDGAAARPYANFIALGVVTGCFENSDCGSNCCIKSDCYCATSNNANAQNSCVGS